MDVYPRAEHVQCNWCGKMLHGPHTDEVYENHNIYAADTEAVYSAEEAHEKGLAHNVSGTMCKDCYRNTIAKGRQAAIGREAAGPHRSEVRASRFAQTEAKRQRRQREIEAARAAEEASIRAREGYRKEVLRKPIGRPRVPPEQRRVIPEEVKTLRKRLYYYRSRYHRTGDMQAEKKMHEYEQRLRDEGYDIA